MIGGLHGLHAGGQDLAARQAKQDEKTLLRNGKLPQPPVLSDAEITEKGINQGMLAQQMAGQHVGKHADSKGREHAEAFG